MTTLVENTPAAWSARAETPAHWEACLWSREGQRARFKSVLAELEPMPGETLLDFGCGTGQLSEHVGGQVRYVGYDSAPGMVARARTDHPGRIFTLAEPAYADVTVCVGPFNLPDHWSKQLTWATLRRLFDKTGRALAVCLYAGEDERHLIYSLDEVEQFGRSESYYHTVERHLPNDLMLVLRH